MIGRGTRLCPGLIDGKDKSQFYIFDFCSNFDFFRINGKGKETPVQRSLQEHIFKLKTEIVYQLQKLEFQTEELIPFREQLVTDLVAKVRELNRDNFAVRLHLKFVDRYSEAKAFETLNYENTLQIAEEIAPLILPDSDDAGAIRFDALMHGIELAYIVGKKYTKAKKDLRKKVRAVANISTIPEIQAQRELLNRILNTDYVETAGINEFEHIREKLRDLMKYIPPGDNATYDTNFDDVILDVAWNQSELENDDLKNYKLKVNHYIRTHQDNEVIAKLKTNSPLTPEDVKELEKILWSEVGTQKDYENEYGNKPLGELVREIVGLDRRAAKEAFSEYLNDVNLDQRQIYFLNQIINHIVANGMLKDPSILLESPFTDMGGVSEVFSNNKSLWSDICHIIETINANAIAI
jgi:type I restriction enzyme R subunit